MVFETREEADAAVQPGQVVSACYLDDACAEPRYFLVPEDASPEYMRERAFLIREGRTISDYEHALIRIAQEQRS